MYAAAFFVATFLMLLVMMFGLSAEEHAALDSGGGETSTRFIVLVGSIFLLALVAATQIALRIIGDRPAWWRAMAGLAPLVAVTALAAGVGMLNLPPRSHLYQSAWSTLAQLRFLLAPIAAIVLLQCSLRAPDRALRRPLLLAALVEVATFATVLAVRAWIT